MNCYFCVTKFQFTELMYIGDLILIVGNFSDILFKEFLIISVKLEFGRSLVRWGFGCNGKAVLKNIRPCCTIIIEL